MYCADKSTVFVLQMAVCILTTRKKNIWQQGDYILSGGYSDYSLVECDAVWIGTVTDVFKQHLPNHATLRRTVPQSEALYRLLHILNESGLLICYND